MPKKSDDTKKKKLARKPKRLRDKALRPQFLNSVIVKGTTL